MLKSSGEGATVG